MRTRKLLIGISTLLIILVFSFLVGAVINYYDPNSNVQQNWDDGTGTGFDQISHSVRQPDTNGITSSFISENTQGANGASEFGFPEITGTPENMTLWVYTTTGGSCFYTFSLRQGGTTRCSASVGSGTAAQWMSCTWDMTGDTSDYSDINVHLSQVSKGAGAHSLCTVYAAYIEVEAEAAVDDESPVYSNNVSSPESPATYSPSGVYVFNATWTDNVEVDTVIISFNGTNHTVSESTTPDVYSFTIEDLGAGIYEYYWWANDTSGNFNSTNMIFYNITRAPGSVSLLLNDEEDDIIIQYPDQVNASVSSSTGQEVLLFRNGSDVTSSNNEYQDLAAGTYNFTAVALENQNYTEASVTWIATINKGTPVVHTYLDNTRNNITIPTNSEIWLNATTIAGDENALLRLYLNETLINEGLSPLSNFTLFEFEGLFNITGVYLESENYTTSSETWFVTVTAQPLVSVSVVHPATDISVEQNEFFNVTINVTCTNDDCGFVNVSLFSNETLVSDVLGSSPFYVNGSNPSIVNLDEGQSVLVTWWVNSTGDFGVYSFYSHAVMDSDPSVSDVTDTWNVTIVEGFGGEPPTYSNVSHSSNVPGDLVTFSVLWDDNFALHPDGHRIFSTNNTGEWVNDSAINFTETPEWANVTTTLNDTINTTIGYKWYASDNAGNWNETEIFTLTTEELIGCFDITLDPIPLCSCEDLERMWENLSANYELQNDVDCSDTVGWDGGAGFLPIGSNADKFTGTFDGGNYTISNLYINRSGTNYQALFGYVENGEVKNVGLINVSVTGSSYIGGLIGLQVSSSVSNSYGTGNVTGYSRVGGLIGRQDSSSVASSYASGSVTGSDQWVGGLIGYQFSSTVVSDSYATGNVYSTGTGQHHGGFIGRNYRGIINNSYSTGSVNSTHSDSGGFAGSVDTGGDYAMYGNFWDNQTSGRSTTAGNATGKTTIEMMNISTFNNTATDGLDEAWDIVLVQDFIDETWFIINGVDYPRLGWQFDPSLLPLSVPLNITLNGGSLNQSVGGLVDVQCTGSIAETEVTYEVWALNYSFSSSLSFGATVNYTSNNTFVVPDNASLIVVEAWGGGGTGGSGSNQGGTVSTGGGGAGGQYASANISVSEGQSFSVGVAPARSGSGLQGFDSVFFNASDEFVVAKGGTPGTNAAGTVNGVGGIGSTEGGVGDIVFRGGSGGNGTSSVSGAGGGGAGSLGPGGDASGGTAGSGAAELGGTGGSGVTGNNQDGNSGNIYGGGGSGGRRTSTGGDGAAGFVRITYYVEEVEEVAEWILVGNHTEGNSVSWDTSPLEGESFNAFRCRAIDLDGSGLWSNYLVLSANTTIIGAEEVPPVVTLLSPGNDSLLSKGFVNFSYEPVEGSLDSCSLYVGNDSSFDVVDVHVSPVSGETNVFEDVFVDHGFFEWNVFCNNSFGLGSFADENFTFMVAPLPPVNFSVSLLENRSVHLEWDELPDTDSYNIYFSDDFSEGFPETPNVTGFTGNSYVDDASSAGKRFYRVTSFAGGFESAEGVYGGVYSSNLEEGFNMASIPFLLDDYELFNGTNNGFIFNLEPDCLLSLWKYNASSDTFHRTDWVNNAFIPATGSEDFTSLTPFEGYWLETNNSCSLMVAGLVPLQNVSISLEENFNLVPWISPVEKSLPIGFDQPIINTVPANSVRAINRFNALNQSFEVTIHYTVNGDPWGWWPSANNPGFTELFPMEGYYFDSLEIAEWEHEP